MSEKPNPDGSCVPRCELGSSCLTQFVPNLIAALQEHMRIYSESYTNVGWTKGPVH